jgi:hypothetical protein
MSLNPYIGPSFTSAKPAEPLLFVIFFFQRQEEVAAAGERRRRHVMVMEVRDEEFFPSPSRGRRKK